MQVINSVIKSVIDISEHARTIDFSQGFVDPSRFHELERASSSKPGAYAIGRYLEERPGMYTAEQYAAIAGSGKSARTVHMGMDFFAHPGTPVRSFADGRVCDFKFRNAELDYGYTVVVEYELPQSGLKLFALYGHLGALSLVGKARGEPVTAGEVIGVVGNVHENGGWEIPHLHFQLSYVAPVDCDYPGVVAREDVPWARLVYPDPTLVLFNQTKKFGG